MDVGLNRVYSRRICEYICFGDFVELYFEDMSHRLKETTLINKRYIVDRKILPVFGGMDVGEVTPAAIRKWQNNLMAYRDKGGRPFSQTYLKSINNQLTAIFNYAFRFYDLKENPCRKAGSMGKSHAVEMSFWTFDEFQLFLSHIQDKPRSYAAFMTLYYTGIRIGELTALTPDDIDFRRRTITISKSYQRLQGRDIITIPKTTKSNRVVVIPEILSSCLWEYLEGHWERNESKRVFPFTKNFARAEILRGCSASGVKQIRVHDIRHSHASLLIELGFSPSLIAERLGHEKIRTTLETYSHLYPNKQHEVAEKLDLLTAR